MKRSESYFIGKLLSGDYYMIVEVKKAGVTEKHVISMFICRERSDRTAIEATLSIKHAYGNHIYANIKAPKTENMPIKDVIAQLNKVLNIEATNKVVVRFYSLNSSKAIKKFEL